MDKYEEDKYDEVAKMMGELIRYRVEDDALKELVELYRGLRMKRAERGRWVAFSVGMVLGLAVATLVR